MLYEVQALGCQKGDSSVLGFKDRHPVEHSMKIEIYISVKVFDRRLYEYY